MITPPMNCWPTWWMQNGTTAITGVSSRQIFYAKFRYKSLGGGTFTIMPTGALTETRSCAWRTVPSSAALRTCWLQVAQVLAKAILLRLLATRPVCWVTGVMYASTPKLFAKLKMAKADGSYFKEIAKIERQELLILDDFGYPAF